MNQITVDGGVLDLAYTDPQLKIFFGDLPEEHPDYGTHERFTVVPKGRRLGATHGAAHFCIDAMLDGKSILWVDTVQANLDRYFNRYFRPALKQIKKEHWKYRASQKEFTPCGALLDFRSAEKPENIEGFGYEILKGSAMI